MHDIGWAVQHLLEGNKIRHTGWNGNGMWLSVQIPSPKSEMAKAYVYMKTTNGDLVPWLCSQSDLFATDWELAN